MSLNVPTFAASSKRFVFLDSIRGLCALTVMLVHAQGMLENVKTNGLFDNVDFISKFLIGFISSYSHAFAVNGFFILSSLLLTYRLLEDYSKEEEVQCIIYCVLV